jgi:predicted nucleic acid-binding protein
MKRQKSSPRCSAHGAATRPVRSIQMNAAILDTDIVLERWPLERNWGSIRKAELERHLAHYTVLPVNRELCRKWAEISFDAGRQGRHIQTADTWVAATALYYQVPLITHNRDDYTMVRGLSVLSV